MAGQLEAEGRGLGMDAVAAADAQGVLVLAGAALERGQQAVQVPQQQVGCLRHLYGQASIQDIRGGHAEMNEPRLRPDMFGQAGQEGDDVVLDLPFDHRDARKIPGAALAHGFGGGMGDHTERRLGIAGMGLDLVPNGPPAAAKSFG